MAQKEVKKDNNAEDYSRYLLQGEKLIKAYHIGFKQQCTVLLSNLKVIILEKFPRNQIEVEYKDVEVVEYYTFVQWFELLYAVLSFIVVTLLFFLKDSLLEETAKLVPTVASVAESATTDVIIIVVSIAIIFFGLFKLGSFLISLRGKFRMLLYEQAPVEVITKCTPEVEELIKQIEQKKRNGEKKKEEKTQEKTEPKEE